MATYTDTNTFGLNIAPMHSNTENRFIVAAATMATSLIDGAVNKCYTVPFSVTYPPLIVAISDILTKIILDWIMEKGRLPKVGDLGAGQDMNPMQLLKDICTGDFDLPGVSRKATLGAWMFEENRMPIFEVDHPVWHVADQGFLDDLLDQRLDALSG